MTTEAKLHALAFFTVFATFAAMRCTGLLTDGGFVTAATWTFGVYMIGQPVGVAFNGMVANKVALAQRELESNQQ